MVKYFRAVILVLTVSVCGSFHAFAGSFTGQEVQNVIQAMKVMDSSKLPVATVLLNDFSEGKYENVMDESGNLVLFRGMFAASKGAQGEYQHLSEIALGNGFVNVEDWAKKSDAILMVFMLTQIPRTRIEDLMAITPEQLKTFSEEEQVDVLELKKMFAALLGLSQDDIDTFAPYVSQYTSQYASSLN